MAKEPTMEERARSAIQTTAQVAGAISQHPVPQDATALQVKARYSTAVTVMKPRDLKEVQRRCKEEAAFAGDALYYSWSQGGEVIEGPSVQCTNIAARHFGNCAVDVIVEESADAYIFYGSFIDLETGYNYTRPFRMSKVGPKKKDGSPIYKDERGKDIIFQIGASKASRNAVANAVPRWLIDEMVEIGKSNVVAKFEKMGPEKARHIIQSKAAALGVSLERLEAKFGKMKGWQVREFIQLSSGIRAIEDGIESADELFPVAAGSAEVVDDNHPDLVAEYEQAIDLVANKKEVSDLVVQLTAAVASEKLTDAERNKLIGRLADKEKNL